MTVRLSILLPTYRFDALTRQNIAALATCAGPGVQVLIGDNSMNREKHAFLAAVARLSANVEVYCHPENIGANNNYRYLLERSQGEFCCLAADDDVFSVEYFLGGAALMDAQTAVGAGLIIGTTPRLDGTSDVFRVAQRLEATAYDRIVAYDGYNMIPYGVTRRDHMVRLFRYVDETPLPASYMDFIGAYAALAEGKFRIDESKPIYLYVNNNWSSEDVAWKTSAGVYVALGLPETFQHFHSVAWVVACLHYFLSRHRPPSLDEAEAERIGHFLVLRFMADFREKHARNHRLCLDQLAHDPAATAALHDFVAPVHLAPAWRFSRFLIILNAFSSSMAERYRLFLASTLVHAIHAPGSAEDVPPCVAG